MHFSDKFFDMGHQKTNKIMDEQQMNQSTTIKIDPQQKTETNKYDHNKNSKTK